MADSILDSKTLHQLIGRIKEGDDAAFAPLLNHTAQRFESLARHMLRGYPALKRWVETDDVLQNALRLMRALQDARLDSVRHFMSLAALQIRRELIDLARRYYGPAGLAANHDSHANADPDDRVIPDIADLSHEPSTLAQWSELHEQIGTLPDQQREVIDLIFYDGLSQAEVAKLLGVSVRTVQRRWHGALLMLHEKVVDQWPSYPGDRADH